MARLKWWELTEEELFALDASEITAADWQAASIAHAQQVAEDVTEWWLALITDAAPCPSCGAPIGDHTRRQLRRCDSERPELVVVDPTRRSA